MKIYLNIMVLLFINIMHAQQPPVLTTTSLTVGTDDVNFGSTGNYAMDTANERDQYVGTWQYNQNGILFQVKIEKKDKFLNQVASGPQAFYTYKDVVTFKYRLVKNGITIYNNINQVGFPSTAYVPRATKSGNDDYLYGGFLDATNNVVGTVSITRLNTTPAKINFELHRFGYYFRDPNYIPDTNTPLFTMPIGSIEMVKIN